MSWLKGFYELVKSSDKLGEKERKWVKCVPEIEKAVANLRRNSPGAITKDVLEKIVCLSEGTFLHWWEDYSERLKDPIELRPRDRELRSIGSRSRAISALQGRLKHMEVVSVILRFWCPDNFAIISPPVKSILALAPAKYHPNDYKRYLAALTELKDVHGFKRLADVDLALWSASHLNEEDDCRDLTRQMNLDIHFLTLRLDNLLYGLGTGMQGKPLQQFCLASALCDKDPLTAGLVVSRACEWAVCEIAFCLPNVRRWEKDSGVTKLKHCKDELERLGRLGALEAQWGFNLSDLIHLRNEHVHYEQEARITAGLVEAKAAQQEEREPPVVEKEIEKLNRLRAEAFIGATNCLMQWQENRARR